MLTKTNISDEPFLVLIADDDVPTRMLLRAAVSQWGYQTVEAGNGEEAWHILQSNNPPQLLILDWLMPKLDGIALCERMKQSLQYHPYTILLTQLAGTTNLTKALDAGADEFLSKPFNMAELHSRLSIGKRIIRYEKQLLDKNSQLKNPSTELSSNSELLTFLEKFIALKGGTIRSETDNHDLTIFIKLPNQK